MLRTTVIAKTDLVQSTKRIRKMDTGALNSLLDDHSQLITSIIKQHSGQVLKGEGDAFWLTFASVTGAAQAAIAIQRELSNAQLGITESERLKIRVVISAGDLLLKDGDLYGSAMATTARIEGLTPADEIYLSHSAWTLINHAQVKTEFVKEVLMKGFDVPEKVYRVIANADIETKQNQWLVFCDLLYFTAFVHDMDIDSIAYMLTTYESLWLDIARKHNGILRVMAGDTYLINFNDGHGALQAVDEFLQKWEYFLSESGYDLPAVLTMNYGDYYVFRRHLFGETVNKTAQLIPIITEQFKSDPNMKTLLTSEAYAQLKDTAWAERIVSLDGAEQYYIFLKST